VNWPEVRTSRDGERLVCVSVACGFPFARQFEDIRRRTFAVARTGLGQVGSAEMARSGVGGTGRLADE
jgi:hypothetical protein